MVSRAIPARNSLFEAALLDIDRSRDTGAESIGDVMKQNPISVLLTAASLAWVIASSLRSRQQYSGAYSVASDQPAEDERGPEEDEPGLKLKEKLGEKLRGGADAAKRGWRASRTAASGRVSEALSATRARARQGRQRAQSIADEQPLVLAALAMAAGAVIGASLPRTRPRTRIENRTVGSARDRSLQKANEAGERGYEETVRSKLEPSEHPQVSDRAS
jgi:hypothetical protein